jgi:hypothetical protein
VAEAPLQTTVELGAEFRVRRRGSRGEGADDDLAAHWEVCEAVTEQVTELALDTMADDGVADDPTHDEPDPSRVGPVMTQDVDDQEVAAAAAAPADHPPEVTSMGEPMRRGEHGRGSRAGGRAARALTARLLRPLRRRADRMLRPARVRMRSRNPCTLWRRRLFG